MNIPRALSIVAVFLATSIAANAAEVVSGPTLTMDPNNMTPLAGVVEMETDIGVVARLNITDGIDSWEVNFPYLATVHYLPVLGLKPDRTYDVEVSITPGAGQVVDVVGNMIAVTDPLPADFPLRQVVVSEPEFMEPGFTVVDCFRRQTGNPAPRYTLIVDSAGEVVWYSTICGRAILQTINGNLFFQDNTDAIEVDMLGNVQLSVALDAPGPLLLLHHDLVRTPMGTYLSLGRTTVVIPDFPTSDTDPNAPTATADVRDNPAVEFFPDGTLRREWLFSEMIQPTRIGYDSLDPTNEGFNWNHANAITYSPSDDTLLASLRHQDAVVKFSRQTGELVWILGPHANWSPEFQPFLLHPVNAPFLWQYHQHAPNITGDGTVLLFDNGNNKASPFDGNPLLPPKENFSRGVEYAIDEETMEIQQVWEYGENIAETIFAGFVGDADWLPQTGNVLMTFGAVSWTGGVPASSLGLGLLHIRIVEASDQAIPETVFDMQLYDPDGLIQGYRSQRIPGLYPQEYVKQPNGVGDTLMAIQGSPSVEFEWSTSAVDALHSAADYYIFYVSSAPNGGFSIEETTTQTTATLSDPAALEFYMIVAANAAGTSGDEPAP